MFSIAALLLIGGIADYLSLSALVGGLLAGLFWGYVGGVARDCIERDVRYLRHPLVVLMLLTAGAKTTFSGWILILTVAYLLLRIAGKLLGGWLTRQVPGVAIPDSVGCDAPAPRRLRHRVRARRVIDDGGVRNGHSRRHRTRQHRFAVGRRTLAAGGDTRVRQVAALILAVVVVLWVRAIGGPIASGTAGAALAIGFTLLGAWIFGDLLRRFRLPRLTGYLLFGVLIGPNVGNVITETMAAQLQVVTGIATTLIALIAGLTLNLERLSLQFTAIARLTAITLVVAMAGVGVVMWIAWPWLPIAPGAGGLERLSIVTLLVVIIVSFSPTMTAAVTTETGARGRLSETGADGRRARRPRDPRALLVRDAVRARRRRRDDQRRRQPARPLRVGNRRRRGVRRPRRRAVRALSALRRSRGHAGRPRASVRCSARWAARSSSSRCWPRWPPVSSSRTCRSLRATR